MPTLIKRCPEYTGGYKADCQELYDNHVIYFRPTNPATIDDNWFLRTKPWYDWKEQGKGYGSEILRQGLRLAKEHSMEKVLLTINSENKASIHICEKLGGVLQDTIDAYNEAEGHHQLRRYWITL